MAYPELKVTVVVPVYNSAGLLSQCLEGLLHQELSNDLKLEIIVVDDGSTDESIITARKFQRYGIKLVEQLHRGAGSARNRGVQEAAPESSVILFTDADCVPTPKWAASLAWKLAKAPPNVVGVKGIYQTRQKSGVARFVQAEFEERYDRFRAPGPIKLELDFADTYSAAYRHEILRDYHFDENLPGAVVEDAELGWRLREAGYSFIFEPAAKVYHTHPEKIKIYFFKKFRIGFWRVVIYRRYPDRIFSDSHTSSAAKMQMVLVGLILAVGGFAILVKAAASPSKWGKYGGVTSAVCFFILQLSYTGFIRRRAKDLKMSVRCWVMLNCRNLAYFAGAISGLAWVFTAKLITKTYKS